MNEILKRKRELNEELEKLDKELAKLEQEKFRKNIGKYFRFNLESRYKGYIKIIDLYKLSDNYTAYINVDRKKICATLKMKGGIEYAI